MSFRICKVFEIESGHMLSKHPGNCRFPHGHSRRVEIVLTSDGLNSADMVCDFKAVKLALEPFLKQWDHALCLNTEDPNFAHLEATYRPRVIAFPKADPTSEMMAKLIFEEAVSRIRQLSFTLDSPADCTAEIKVERVRVTETSSSWAEYFE